jgi:predicted transcriptional regulator
MPISFSVLLDEETSRLLHLLSESSDRSRSGLIRHLIRQAAADSPLNITTEEIRGASTTIDSNLPTKGENG